MPARDDDAGDDECRARHPKVVHATPLGGIRLLERRLLGHWHQSTPCGLAEG